MEVYMTITLPQFPESYWLASTPANYYPALAEDIETEVCIIGGGITGMTTAYLLAKQGKKVVLVDSDVLFAGTTGNTTAKVTAQHGLIYDEFTRFFGLDKAKQFYKMQTDAISLIKKTIQDLQIDCAFTSEDATIYTNDDKEVQKIQDEFKAYQALGIEGAYIEKVALPIASKAAVVMKQQGQFHPLQYLAKLRDAFVELGGQIFERTVITDAIDKGGVTVTTKSGKKISCQFAVIASHFPFVDKMGFYFAKMHVERSYVIAIKTDFAYPGGIFINAEQPTRSIRQVNYNGESLLLVGGENHIAARGEQTSHLYENLMQYAMEHFAPTEVRYRWSAQDLVSTDKLPYIGPITSGNEKILVATGFRKWGMTNGTAAAQILTDTIMRRKNEFSELVSPQRFHPVPSIKNLASNLVEMAKELVGGKLEKIDRTPESLAIDEGGVVKVNGKRAGAYRDLDGKLHLVDTTCTHMGCELNWNSGDRSWDCPCHGSRYNVAGEVMEGPTKKPLKKVEIEGLDE